MSAERVVASMNESELGQVDHFELLSSENEPEVVSFFRNQFRDVDEWCDLSELATRLQPRNGLATETIGIVDRHRGKVVGAVIAYRNPFSHDEWRVPIIAIERGNEAQNLPSFRVQGRGRLLMTGLFDAIKEFGGKTVVTDTNKLTERGGSRSFLEKCGFQLIGEIPGYFDGKPGETGLIFIYHP